MAIVLAIMALVMEFIDSFLGMMYGTVLSPLLILAGYDAKTVVPAILISQAAGGFVASWRHHKLGNADFSKGTIDRQISVTVIWLGVVASIVGVFLSVAISAKALNTYIAVLVILIALMIFTGKTFTITSSKIFALGFVSAFNKALSGGGFGPLVAGGQLVLNGREEKGAIGSTDFAEAPICLISFILWLLLKGVPDLWLTVPLCVGAGFGGFFGPEALSRITSRNRLKLVLGIMVFLEGFWVLYKVWIK